MNEVVHVSFGQPFTLEAFLAIVVMVPLCAGIIWLWETKIKKKFK